MKRMTHHVMTRGAKGLTQEQTPKTTPNIPKIDVAGKKVIVVIKGTDPLIGIWERELGPLIELRVDSKLTYANKQNVLYFQILD